MKRKINSYKQIDKDKNKVIKGMNGSNKRWIKDKKMRNGEQKTSI